MNVVNEYIVRRRIKLLAKIFNLSNEDAMKLAKIRPSVLKINEEDLLAKKRLYAKYGWSNEILATAIIKNKNFLSMKNADIEEKIRLYREIGISYHNIITSPQLLNCPIRDIKVKYMYAVTTDTKKILFSNSDKKARLIYQAFTKTYARGEYLKNSKESVLENIGLSERKFSKKFDVTYNELRTKYILDNTVFTEIQIQYNNHLSKNKNEEHPYLELTEDEKENGSLSSALKDFRKSIKQEKLDKKVEKEARE